MLISLVVPSHISTGLFIMLRAEYGEILQFKVLRVLIEY